MSIRIKSVTAATLILTLLLAACGGTTDTKAPETPVPQKQVSIESFGWVIKNDHPSRSSDGATAFLRTSVIVADTGLEADDFASVRVTSPAGNSWVDDEASDFEDWFDPEKNSFYIGSLYSSKLDGGSYVALGNYTVEVTLKNGNTAKKTLLVPAPGSTGTEGYEFAYTENYSNAANPPSNFVALPERAAIENVSLDVQASSLELDFSAKGDDVYSGWIEVYDMQDKYIGRSKSFRDYETGQLMAQINAGNDLLTDGTMNTLVVSAEQMNFFDTASFSDIASLLIVLTDGEQYAGIKSPYDVISVSEEVDIPVNN